MAEDYGIDSFVPADVQARRAGVAAEQGNAAEAQKAYEIAPQTGLPPSIVQYNLPGFQGNIQRDQNNTILDSNRRLQNFIIDDPVRAVAAKDNYAELDNMSKIADPSMDLAFQTEGGLADVGPTVKAAGAGVAQGYQERQYGILAHRQLLGEEGLEPALQSYEKQMAGEDEYQGFNYLVNSFGKLVGNIGASAAASAPSFAAGAGVGGAVGGLPGAVAGAGAGLTAGILYDQYKAQAGAFFRESGKVLDRNGNPLPLEVRKAMALGVASVNTMLMGVAPLAAHAGIGAIMSEATLRAISEPGVLNAVTRVLAKAGLGGAEFGAINVGMEASQIAATEIGKATTGQDFNTIVNDPATREAAVQRVTQGLVNGLTLGAVLPFTPLGTNYLRDKIAVAQSNFEARQRDLLHSAVQDSDIFKQSPSLVADWLKVHEGLDDVYVPADEVAKRREEFSYVPDVDTQLETQLPLGGDVKIPAAYYYTNTSPETHAALQEKIRGASGVTVEEAKDLQENPPDYPTVFHGSPHSFESFDIGKIGTGEGAQAYGHGLYFAERRGIAEDYQRQLSETAELINGQPVDFGNPQHLATKMLEFTGDIDEAIGHASAKVADAKFALEAGASVDRDFDLKFAQEELKLSEETLKYLQDDKSGKAELPHTEYSTGHLYQAKIMRPKEHFLDLDAPFEEQSPYVQEALKGSFVEPTFPAKTTGRDMYEWITQKNKAPPRKMTPEVLEALKSLDNLGFDTPAEAMQAIRAVPKYWKSDWDVHDDPAGKVIDDYLNQAKPERPDKLASQELSEAGIAGVKYADASSRRGPPDPALIQKWKDTLAESEKLLEDSKGDDPHVINMIEGDIETAKAEIERLTKATDITRNFVVFNDKDILITHKNDVARQIEEALERTTEQIMAGMNLQPTGKQTFLNSILENKAAGLDKRTFDQLSKRVQEVQRQITQKAYDVAHTELMRREKPLYKNELAAETERAREDLEKRPDILAYQAMVNLKKDHPFSIKLDRNEVDGLYNRESPADYAAFQKGTRASESFPDKMFAKDGIHPDEAAGLIGFSSGKELLDHVREYERAVRESGGTEKQYFEKLVKDEGKRRMEEKDNLNERVSAEAIELALSVKQVDVLIAEMHALVPGEETKLTRDAVQQATEQIFAKVNAKKVKSADYERQVAKWGKEAFSHVTAGKPVEALKSLQKQLSNFLMAREAKAFEKERTKIEGIVQKFQSRKSLDNVSQEYTDRFHSILADLDRPIPVDIRDLEDSLKGKTFERFIADEKERTGKAIADTDWLHGPPGYAAPRMDDLSVEQYRQLAETFESLYELGRKDKQLQIGDKKLDFDTVKERLVRYAKGMADKRGRIIEKETGIRGTLTRVGRLADATFREPQYLFKRLDADDPTGPWSQDLYRPLYDNENAKHDRLKAIAEDVAKLYDEDWTRRSKDLVTNNFLDDRGRPREITQAQKMMMLLHSGNDHNMRLLAHTMGEDVDTVREWLKKNVTEQDLKVAHGILDEFEKLWPDLRDMTRRVMGVSPAKVRARGYETPAGRFEGGYFPSIRDRDTIEAVNRDAIFDRSWFDPATDSRAAHERTGGLYKLSLDLGELPYILRQTVHDIYMREAVENALAIIRDPEIKGAFNDAWGPEYGDQLIPWLRYIANDGSVPMKDGLGAAYQLSRYARQNMVAVLVGGRISTAAIHGMSAASQSITEVGPWPFMKETLSLISKSKENEKTAWDRAFTYSSAIRNRMHNMYTSLESEVPRMLGQSNARQEYLAFSTRLIAYLDMLSAVVVFNARLKQAMHGGASWDDAVWTANRSVDLAHGSNTIVNRPSIMRGGEGSKWYTQFMGFFNNTYNRMREIGVQVNQGNYMQALIGTIGFMAATSLVHMGVRYNQKEGPGKQLAESVALTVTGGVPIARDAMRGILGGGDYGEGLVTTTTKGITAPLADLERLVTGKPVSQDWVAHLLQAPGFGMGFLPGISGMGPKVLTGHIGDWLTLATTKAGSGYSQFIYDKFYRHSLEPPDWRRGILEGNFHQRKAH
jgi:hypothetical protein